MIAMLNTEFERYRSLHLDFFDFIVSRNVPAVSNNAVRDVLTHVVNYSPSAAVAQLSRYVFKNEYEIDDVCEFLSAICKHDDLFQHRTMFIVHRYAALGHQVSQSILSQVCQDDQFLYPLTTRRISSAPLSSKRDDGRCRGRGINENNDEDEDDEDDDDDRCIDRNDESSVRDIEDSVTREPLLSHLGECRKYDEFSRKTFQRPEIARTMCEFFASRGKDPIDALTTSGDRTDIGNVFALANVLHWRYDGVSAVDSSTGTHVDLTRMEKRAYAQSFVAQLTLAAIATTEREHRGRTRCDFNEYRDDRDAEDDDNDDGQGSSSSSRRRCGAGESRRSLDKSIGIHLERMRRSLDTFLSTADRDEDGCDGVAKNEETFVDGSVCAKFVRYADRGSGDHIVLNLILNRFELRTPTMPPQLTINYDDFNAPRTYRFNETRDDRVFDFVCRAFRVIDPYFADLCSRDMNHYLYSTIVPSRIPVTYDENDAPASSRGGDGVVATAVATAANSRAGWNNERKEIGVVVGSVGSRAAFSLVRTAFSTTGPWRVHPSRREERVARISPRPF